MLTIDLLYLKQIWYWILGIIFTTNINFPANHYKLTKRISQDSVEILGQKLLHFDHRLLGGKGAVEERESYLRWRKITIFNSNCHLYNSNFFYYPHFCCRFLLLKWSGVWNCRETVLLSTWRTTFFSTFHPTCQSTKLLSLICTHGMCTQILSWCVFLYKSALMEFVHTYSLGEYFYTNTWVLTLKPFLLMQ